MPAFLIKIEGDRLIEIKKMKGMYEIKETCERVNSTVNSCRY